MNARKEVKFSGNILCLYLDGQIKYTFFNG